MPPRTKKNKPAAISGLAPERPIVDYRFDTKRKNLPPAGLAAQGKLEQAPRVRYAYDPHRPPVLRFDGSGVADRLTELLVEATRRTLTDDEARTLREALAQREPWLEWAGKRETHAFSVEPVALHLHERISAQAILRIAARKEAQRDLFADPQLPYREAVQFYRHDVDWTNRMILGDSLQVMASLARREDLAGKVQMIYLDPPYGIRFASNFQPEVGKRDVKDKDADLTREPEMVKAYRDTWTLGVHSYLAYLRDRLIVARELLADAGCIFVQISDENLHRVRAVIDEVFGTENFCSIVTFQKTGSIATNQLPSTVDYLLWYGKNRERTRYRQLYITRETGDTSLERYDQALLMDGQSVGWSRGKSAGGVRRFQLTSLFSDGASSKPQSFAFRGSSYWPKGNSHWKTATIGLTRLAAAARIEPQGERLRYVRFAEDFPLVPIDDRWQGVQTGKENIYVVQTASKVVERCVRMTTDPGDLVFDPTCGSGTTAHVAEQWGRRRITCDTSRVALARQRLLTARYDYYALRPVNEVDLARNDLGPWLADPTGELKGAVTLECETVPHVTLKSIAQNVGLDPIFVKHTPILDASLGALNKALAKVPASLRTALKVKLATKEKTEGKRAVTDADRRR